MPLSCGAQYSFLLALEHGDVLKGSVLSESLPNPNPPSLWLSAGEIVVTEVNFVRKCVGPDCSPDDLWGKLVCTNFKISFVTHGSLPRQVGHNPAAPRCGHGGGNILLTNDHLYVMYTCIAPVYYYTCIKIHTS